ncbi:DUF58 domain-containing protein [Halosegnis sp.]|uniref:DUF58 domain-containing protein n=1 Tax=Halosegnis sp. TaxID=2864959 RepID=UPI0035D50D80
MTIVADRRTDRWTGIAAVGLFAVAAGVLFTQAGLLLVAAVAVVAAAAARFATPPAATLAIDRRVQPTDPAPDDPVTVTLRVRNDGDRTLPDIRVIDGVPGPVQVTEGSPRLATALRPGRTAVIEYTIAGPAGRHEFEATTVLVRGYTGAWERELSLTAAGDDWLQTRPRLAETDTVDAPLRPHATPYAGRLTTDTGGAGVEFRAVRDYRPGDSLSRVDWRRLARDDDLATVEFSRERAASVVLVVDTRTAAHVGGGVGRPSAATRALSAVPAVAASLLAAGDRVGLASFGPQPAWLAPGAGDDHRARLRRLLGDDPAFAPTPSEAPFLASVRLAALRTRLPAGAQVLFCSPLADEYAVSVARRLDAAGHPVSVLSPDPTDTTTTGHRLARLERRVRLSRLRRAGIRVIDWAEEPLAVALQTARRRWSA